MSKLTDKIDSNFEIVDEHLTGISDVWYQLNQDVKHVPNDDVHDAYFERLALLHRQIESLLFW